jgi:mannitol/fructose-specific phosphotransferase system IIA component (Ntr-type)
LGNLMTERHIVVWDDPAAKDDVIRRLVEVVDDTISAAEQPAALAALYRREEQGTTFFNEGAAFPHARLETLSRPCIALGITRGGISDVDTPRPIHLVWLILAPLHDPKAQVDTLAQAARAAQDRHLVQALLSSPSPLECSRALREWARTERMA